MLVEKGNLIIRHGILYGLVVSFRHRTKTPDYNFNVLNCLWKCTVGANPIC